MKVLHKSNWKLWMFWDRHWMEGTYGRCTLEVDKILEKCDAVMKLDK